MNQIHQSARHSLITATVFIIAAIVTLSGCSKDNSTQITKYNKSINILIPQGGFFTTNFFAAFEKEFKINVNVHVIDDNYRLSQPIEQSNTPGATNYDLAMSFSREMFLLQEKGLLDKIDADRLHNFKTLDAFMLKRSLKPHDLHYGIPYMMASVGIAYKVNDFEQMPESWADIFNPEKLKKLPQPLVLPDIMRDVLGVALLSLSNSPNSVAASEIEKAGDLLVRCAPYCLPLSKNPLSALKGRGAASATITYGNDMLQFGETNTAIRFTIPKEGSILALAWFVIPKSATSKDSAYTLLNYLLRPRVAARASNESGIATVIEDALPFVKRSLINGPSYFVPEKENTHVLKFTAEAETFYDQAWKKVRTATENHKDSK